MKLHVINLERSGDRRAHMQDQLERLTLPFEFFRGIDALRGELEGISRYDERAALWRLGHPLQRSELGCFASHFRLWQRCATSGDPMVIMEDDVEVGPQFPVALRLAAENIDRYRFIRLAGLSARRFRPIAQLDSTHQLVRYLKGPRGTQCYALSAAGAAALLEHAQTWIDAVDLYIDGFWIHGLPSYAIRPSHIGHVGEHILPTLVGGLAGAASRPWHRSVRRASTHFLGRLRRALFNLRYRLGLIP